MRHRALLLLGKIIGTLARLRGGGSSIPGLIVEKIDSNIVSSFRPHFSKVILVTGTNGKTTTTKMLQEILRSKYSNIVHNEAGSNMSRGIITAVAMAASWKGELKDAIGLFEVDEGFVSQVSAQLKPDVLVALNLHRDQLDRYGELERVAEFIQEASSHAEMSVINIDDPRLLKIYTDNPDRSAGVAASEQVRALVPSDDELGTSDRKRPVSTHTDADIYIASSELAKDGRQVSTLEIAGKKQTLHLKIPGVFNVYNAASALMAARCIGIETAPAMLALAEVEPAFGRAERIEIDGKILQILLVKNPSGFNQVITNFLVHSAAPVLIAINDNYADGRDVSWLWDVDIEHWQPQAEQAVRTSGVRGFDMALRLHYGEIEAEVDTSLEDAIDALLEKSRPGEVSYIVPTYTAMLEIRKLLAKRVPLGGWE